MTEEEARVVKQNPNPPLLAYAQDGAQLGRNEQERSEGMKWAVLHSVWGLQEHGTGLLTLLQAGDNG